MNMRHLLPLLLLLLASLAACSREGSAPEPVQAPTEATAPQAPAEPAQPQVGGDETVPAEEAASDTTAPAAPAPAAPTGPAPVAGVDYKVIEGGQPFQPVAGKIEAAEGLGYTCPHCASLDPILESWRARQPADVTLAPVANSAGHTS